MHTTCNILPEHITNKNTTQKQHQENKQVWPLTYSNTRWNHLWHTHTHTLNIWREQLHTHRDHRTWHTYTLEVHIIYVLSNKQNTLTYSSTITYNTKTATTEKQIRNSFNKQFIENTKTQIGQYTDLYINYNHLTLHSQQLKSMQQ